MVSIKYKISVCMGILCNSSTWLPLQLINMLGINKRLYFVIFKFFCRTFLMPSKVYTSPLESLLTQTLIWASKFQAKHLKHTRTHVHTHTHTHRHTHTHTNTELIISSLIMLLILRLPADSAIYPVSQQRGRCVMRLMCAGVRSG